MVVYVDTCIVLANFPTVSREIGASCAGDEPSWDTARSWWLGSTGGKGVRMRPPSRGVLAD